MTRNGRLVLVDVMNDADIGMIENRSRSSFPPKAFQPHVIGKLCSLVGQELASSRSLAEYGSVRFCPKP